MTALEYGSVTSDGKGFESIADGKEGEE